MTKKTNIVATIAIVAIAAVAVAKFMPNTAKTVKNKVTTIDSMIGDANLIENYKAEYVNLTKKKEDIEKAIQDFTIQIGVAKKKLELEKSIKSKFFDQLDYYSKKNNVKSFNLAKTAFESQEAKCKMLETSIVNYENGKAKLEAGLSVVNMSLTKYKSNIDILEGRKTIVDNFKEVNRILQNLSGTGENDMAIQLEKVDDSFMVETTKMEVLEDTVLKNQSSTIESQKDMSDYVSSHR